MKQFHLDQQVVLSKSLPQYDLQKGDLATIVEIIDKGGKRGYCLEIFDSSGHTLKVIIADESDISEITPSIINYRQLQNN
ncbi:MAG: DUF4926 domain-containing protein [Ginsengibacter sp.]